MGTRGFVGFIADGQLSHNYQQYDSYPAGVGLDVLNWARKINAEDGWREVKNTAAKLIRVDASDSPSESERVMLLNFTDTGVSTGTDWYSVLRATQGDPEAILKAGYVCHDDNWPLDSLFCEWGYLINLDVEGGALEVYQGFQTAEHNKGIFASSVGSDKWNDNYYPVKLVASYSLRNLPDDKTFLAIDKDDE